jgi:hypothetical protein
MGSGHIGPRIAQRPETGLFSGDCRVRGGCRDAFPLAGTGLTRRCLAF